jgi:Fe-S-cluster containining protein
MTCLRCGECCFPYSVSIAREDNSRRWLTYHGIIVREASDDRMVITGHSRCEMLQFGSDGKASCAVYSDRPTICQNFLCGRAQQESE